MGGPCGTALSRAAAGPAKTRMLSSTGRAQTHGEVFVIDSDEDQLGQLHRFDTPRLASDGDFVTLGTWNAEPLAVLPITTEVRIGSCCSPVDPQRSALIFISSAESDSAMGSRMRIESMADSTLGRIAGPTAGCRSLLPANFPLYRVDIASARRSSPISFANVLKRLVLPRGIEPLFQP